MGEARRRVAKRYYRVEIQKSAMTAVPGAGIGVGVCTQTKGCGWRPNRLDQAIAMPGNTATSATKYCPRNSLAIVVRRLGTKPRHSRRSPPPGCGRHAPA